MTEKSKSKVQNQNQKQSQIVKRGKRTYFFDIKEASNGNNYLKVTESRFIKEGEDHKRNVFTLFKDDIEEFILALSGLKEML